MSKRSIKAKTKGDEFEAFDRQARRLLSWPRGEPKRVKTAFWRRLRAKLRSHKAAGEE